MSSVWLWISLFEPAVRGEWRASGFWATKIAHLSRDDAAAKRGAFGLFSPGFAMKLTDGGTLLMRLTCFLPVVSASCAASRFKPSLESVTLLLSPRMGQTMFAVSLFPRFALMVLDRQYRGAERAGALVVRTWQSEASLSVLLGFLALTIFVLPLTELVNRYFSLYVDLTYSLMLLVGLALAWFQRRAFHVMLIVTILSVAVRWGARWYPELGVYREAAMLASVLVTTYIVITQVFRSGRVTSMRLQGSLAVYLLFGVAWAHAYQLVSSVYPGKAFSSHEPMTTVSAWLYYSFATLTTLGYGDVVPISRVARMLAVGEATTGQIYLTVLVARLVALQVEARHEPDGAVVD